MELQKMKKEELITLLKEQEHLAQAVEAKDIDISKLSKDIVSSNKKVEDLSLELKSKQHLAQAVEAKDVEIVNLRSELGKSKVILAEEIKKIKEDFSQRSINKDLELESLREKLSKVPELEKLQEAIATLSANNKILVGIAGAQDNAFRNFMKSIQGSLDNAIELEAIINSSYQNKK